MLDRENLTGKQKAAVLLLNLGEDATAEVFKRLEEDEVQDISRELSIMGTIPAEVSDMVVEEFYNMTLANEYITVGGLEYAKKVLIKSLGPEEARKIIDRLVKLLEKSAGFSSLEKVNPQQLSKFIQNEHPQTIALILAHLSASQAAELISSLPEEMRAEILIRMANLEEISPEIVKKIAGVLDQKLEALGSYSLEEYGGVKAVAELFNRMDRRASRNVLEQIESRSPELAASIKDLMFVFEDILLIDDQGIMEILKRVDKKSLSVALKGSTEELKTKFFRNMSSRAVEMLKEEMEYLGPIRVKDVEKAQHEIVEVVRSLEEEGVIVIGGAGGDEYVV
ncbi:MAG TPA: flagellar motor switch protein FliG [Candidatus Aminicenantes bacterium]|nr:flagellar motor switch protein FliG [Candidatus Aminicenantes bacterium]